MNNQQEAKEKLDLEANRILQLIQSQKEHSCFAQCPAFEEVMDTQMYGFSKQIAFAISIGVITDAEGQKILNNLDQELNKVYTEIFEEHHSFRMDGGLSENKKSNR